MGDRHARGMTGSFAEMASRQSFLHSQQARIGSVAGFGGICPKLAARSHDPPPRWRVICARILLVRNTPPDPKARVKSSERTSAAADQR
jgi:hypothetical protein